jgi:hypothetical protein
MKTPRLTRLLALAVLCTASATQAATISLAPSAPLLAPNSTFTINLLLDASDAPGSHPGLYVGKVILDFDPAKIAFQSFAFTSPVGTLTGGKPVLGTSGSRQTVVLGFTGATDTSQIGTFTFLAGANPGGTTIGLAEYQPFPGTFFSKLPTDQRFHPVASGTSLSISAVPLPGAAWLFLTGLGAVAARAARRRNGLRHAA